MNKRRGGTARAQVSAERAHRIQARVRARAVGQVGLRGHKALAPVATSLPVLHEMGSAAAKQQFADESAIRVRPSFPDCSVAETHAPSEPLEVASTQSLGTLLKTNTGVNLGAYRLVCELASGGMGTVYFAIRSGTQGFAKYVAVKRIHSYLVQDPEFAEMFIDEARFAARVNHPNVCSVFDFGRSGQNYYIAMEYLHGEPLSRLWEITRASSQRTSDKYARLLARVFAELAEGLHAVHSLKDSNGRALEVVHRDVTPQNLFVLFDGTVRVTDLGIARAREQLCNAETLPLHGKLAYMAPEQYESSSLDTRVDVWSLGVVLWELLTLERLFEAPDDQRTMEAVLSRPIPTPSSINPNIPQALDAIVHKALQRNPDHRYQTAREFSRDLEKYLASVCDTVPSMDVAEWMTRAFPSGPKKTEKLALLARDVLLRKSATPSSSNSPIVSLIPDSGPEDELETATPITKRSLYSPYWRVHTFGVNHLGLQAACAFAITLLLGFLFFHP